MSRDCQACENLRENAPEFVQNGVTTNVCNSLKNNTGFSTSNKNNNCTDLDDANDCLVGNMEDELEAYDVCDWKDYMKKFVPNVWSVLKAMICSMCGLWTKVEKLECEVKYLFNGATFRVGETPTEGSYAVAGKGVSFLIPKGESEQHTADLNLTYVAGGLMRWGGTFRWYTQNFNDDGTCYNFDNGSKVRQSKARLGNPVWNTEPPNLIGGGELIAEYRIKKSEYPQIRRFFSGIGQETGGGSYHVRAVIFAEGTYAYGQHGYCDENTGKKASSGMDDGHKVPDGWTYIQLRMTSIFHKIGNNSKLSPVALFGVRMNQNAIDC